MSDAHKGRVRRPIQLDLTVNDRRLLEEVATAGGLSTAEVLRRGLRRMAGEILADRHPAMQMLEEMNAADWRDTPRNTALEHDRYLAEAYVQPKAKRKSH